MNPSGVIKLYIMPHPEAELRQADILFDLDVLIFQRPPVVSQNLVTEPVDDSNHKCPMTGYCRISDVCAPYLIRTLYLAFAQKIWDFLMLRMRFRGIEMRPWIDRPQIQAFLQPAHPSMISVPAAFLFSSQTRNSVKWCQRAPKMHQ